MSKLKNSIITQILDNLEYGDFCLEDFETQFPSDSTILAQITFKALPKYNFILDETYSGGVMGSVLAATGQGSGKKVIRTIERPGEYKNNESQIHDGINSAISSVSKWVGNIREDLVNSKAAVRSTIDELTEEFQKGIDENLSDQEAFFDENERDDLEAKLDDLLARVTELESKLDFSSKDSKKLQSVIDKGKSDLKFYPKGVWYKTTGTKLLEVMKGIMKSKEGREILTGMAQKFLQ